MKKLKMTAHFSADHHLIGNTLLFSIVCSVAKAINNRTCNTRRTYLVEIQGGAIPASQELFAPLISIRPSSPGVTIAEIASALNQEFFAMISSDTFLYSLLRACQGANPNLSLSCIRFAVLD